MRQLGVLERTAQWQPKPWVTLECLQYGEKIKDEPHKKENRIKYMS